MTRPTLVFVHGRAQQGRNPDEIKKEWIETLRLGLGRERSAVLSEIDIRLPFYGDRLDAFAQQADEALPADIIVRGDPQGADAEYLDFRAGMLEEIARGLGITQAQADLFLADQVRARGPLNWEWVQALMRAADAIPGVSAASIERVTRDVFLYLSRSTVRKTINKIVSQDIPTSKTVVVAHSLGTVVAYDLIRRAERPFQIPLLITVGSPLGVGPILRTLEPLRFPAGVTGWFNAFDKRDVVAFKTLDHKTFPVAPPIDNYEQVHNRTENAHGISGYLNDPVVSERIYDALLS